jgi:class 3 adenylate cyclase/YHS domain-containing protein
MGTPGEVERAFVFADLCGYTALTEAHGNQHAADVVERFLALATSTLGPGASILERVGDEVVIVADDAAVAVAIALALRAAVAREPLFPLVRAAVHAGGVVERVGGYVGAALNITARVAALTAPGQIVCTEPVARAAPLAGVAYRALGDARLKNIHTPVALFEVVAAATDVPHIDPVCRMQVTADAASVTWQGRAYHFCSEACLAAFRAGPLEYVPG